jgi:hypothetical protein
MGTGSRSPARALGVATMFALVAAASVACGSGSGTSNSKPVHISVAKATQNPCQLVTLGQASAILGSDAATGNVVTASDGSVVAGNYSSCVYGNLTSSIDVSLDFGTLAEVYSTDDMTNSAGMIVAGHAGVCGADTGKYGTKGDFQFAAPIVAAPAESAVWVSVDGARSCAVDAKFAQAVFANL